MNGEKRRTGIDIIGDAPWGTHLCQFYRTKEDLLDILVPYFKAGLENNEFCIWVSSKPLSVKDAEEAMRKAMPDFERYRQRGQIEIVPHTEWYLKDGTFNLQRVCNAWVDKLHEALTKDYDGMRVTGNNAWLGKRDWENFTDYEEELNNVIGEYRMIAVCTYCLDKCGAADVIAVVNNHQSALIRREGEWECIESSERRQIVEVLRESERKYRFLFDSMLNGYAYCQILVDENNQPVDFVYLEVNDAFEKLTGLKREDVIGKRVTEAIPGTKEANPELFSIYGKVALTGEETKFDIYFKPLAIWLTISVFSPGKGYFVAVFDNITERKRAEETLQTAEQNFRNSLDSSPLGIRIVSAEGELLYANQAVLDIYGYSSVEELKATPTKQRYTPESYAEYQDRRKKRKLEKAVPSHYEVSIVRKDDEVRHLVVLRREVVWNGETQFQTLYQDITERKQVEEREKQLQRELNFSGRLASIGELAAGVAHEINNPL